MGRPIKENPQAIERITSQDGISGRISNNFYTGQASIFNHHIYDEKWKVLLLSAKSFNYH